LLNRDRLNGCIVKSSLNSSAFSGVTVQRFGDPTRRAFTLLEMLLAIGISALVLIVINAVLFAALNLRQATAETVDAASPIDSAVNFLKRDLQNCVTPTNFAPDAILSGSFRVGSIVSTSGNEPVSIEMSTATGGLSDTTPWGEVQRVTYELRAPATIGASGRDLYRSVTRNLLSVSTPAAEDQLMLHGVDSIKFSCYDGALWNDTWDTTSLAAVNTNLPVAVRVNIQMAGDANAQPIQLVVPIETIARTNAVLATNSVAGN
jgi:type II secretion system protein J